MDSREPSGGSPDSTTLTSNRSTHTTWLGIEPTFPSPEPSIVPPAFEYRGGNTHHGPLENGAEIGWMEFATPLRHEWRPSEMDMKSHFPVVVSTYDELQFSGRVLEVLPLCLWGVEAVLTIFEPVFSASKPPLPVTAIPNLAKPPLW